MKRKVNMIVVFSVLGAFLVTLLIYYFGAVYIAFNKLDKKKEFEIPGITENFVPQGIEYIEKSNEFLVSGYMSDGKPSRIYVIDGGVGTVKKYITLTENGTHYVGHAGGVASDGANVFVVGDKKLHTLSLVELEKSENEGSVNITSTIETGNGCDFVSVYGENLIVGEFYKEENYETPLIHRIGENSALAYVYNLDNTKTSGIGELSALISLPDKAQGIAISGKNIVISTSWSIPSSKLLVYNIGKTTEKTAEINGKNLPLYVLDSTSLKKTVKAPAMSEEMVMVNDRVFILFESACNKYKLVNRTRTKNVISIKV